MIKKILKRIKKVFIRETILQQSLVEKDNVIFKVQLKMFWQPIRKVEIVINNSVKLPVKTSLFDRKINIELPVKQLSSKNKDVVSLYINGEHMWITSTEDNKLIKSFIIDQSFYNFRIKKNIVIHKTNNKIISSKKIELQAKTHEKSLVISLGMNSNKSFSASDIELYTFRNGKLEKVLLQIEIKDNSILLYNFNLIENIKGYLFLKDGVFYYPIVLSGKQEFVFCGQKHKIEIKNKSDFAMLTFTENILRCKGFSVSQKDEKTSLIVMEISNLVDVEGYDLVLQDRNNINTILPMQRIDNELRARAEDSVLIKDLYNKRVSLRLRQGTLYYYYSVRLTNKHITGVKNSFTTVVDGETIEVEFYRRKDKEAGIRIRRPKLKKEITQLDNFIIEGFIEGFDLFQNVEKYLVIEERDTSNKLYTEITNDFNININKLLPTLMNNKVKEKCIFDFFVEVFYEGKMIRKEKIKYINGDYKKDNYFGRKYLLDEKGNTHYFLFTITPFQNTKIESFMIPKTVDSLGDTYDKNNNIWLIGERYNTAQDNGIIFFRWLQENTTIEAYYVIEESSPDYPSIQDNKNVLVFGSERHFEIATKAKVLLGTHDLENLLPYKQSKGFYHYEDTLKVFLQHGVLGRKNVEYHKKYYETPFDLFIVSSEPEKYDVVMDKLGYEEEEVVVTGLARFDNLIQKSKPRNILVMPTWRDWLNTSEKFINSKYFLFYKSLLENKELDKILEQYQIKLLFYPHYRSRLYFDEMLELNSDNVRIVPFEEKSVQQLLIDSALLVTDYSSVSFDFLYLNKPVIYYQFDAKRFFRSGILRPLEETSLGRTGTTEDEIVYHLIEQIKNGFRGYSIDTSAVLAYQDHRNCQRIYEAVIAKLDTK